MIVRIDAAWALARPNTLSVGSPATTSRKCPASRLSTLHCRSMYFWVAIPISAMNSGISGRVITIVTAEIQSPNTTRASTATGTVTDRTSCGR